MAETRLLCQVTGKICYKHPQAAWADHRVKHRAKWKLGGHAYLCEHCKSWHWTHNVRL